MSPADEKFTFSKIETIKIIKIRITVTIMQADKYTVETGFLEFFPSSV